MSKITMAKKNMSKLSDLTRCSLSDRRPSLGMHNIKWCDQALCRMAGTEPRVWGHQGPHDAVSYVGLEVHKETEWVAVAESGRGG